VQSIDQPVDAGGGILFGDLGQVRITRRGGGTGVAKQTLDMVRIPAKMNTDSGRT